MGLPLPIIRIVDNDEATPKRAGLPNFFYGEKHIQCSILFC